MGERGFYIRMKRIKERCVLPFMDGNVALHKVGLVGGKVAAIKVAGKDGMCDVTSFVLSVVGRISRLVAAVGKRALEGFLLCVNAHMSSQCLPVLGGELAVRPVTLVRPNGVHVYVQAIGGSYRRQHRRWNIGLLCREGNAQVADGSGHSRQARRWQ